MLRQDRELPLCVRGAVTRRWHVKKRCNDATAVPDVAIPWSTKSKPAPLRAPARANLRRSRSLRACVQHRDGAAVLRPARDVVTHRDRALLAVGDRAHALRLHAARDQIVAYRLGAPCTERDVVFARAALVGVALDGEGVAVIAAEP